MCLTIQHSYIQAVQYNKTITAGLYNAVNIGCVRYEMVLFSNKSFLNKTCFTRNYYAFLTSHYSSDFPLKISLSSKNHSLNKNNMFWYGYVQLHYMNETLQCLCNTLISHCALSTTYTKCNMCLMTTPDAQHTQWVQPDYHSQNCNILKYSDDIILLGTSSEITLY